MDSRKFSRILSQLSLPNCQCIEKEEHNKYIIYRYQFDFPQPKPKEAEKERPSWRDVDNHHCHICHRPLNDPFSLKVKIGSKCRKNIEEAEEKDSSMWNDISRKELRRIWTLYNTVDIKRRERAKTESAKPTVFTRSRMLLPLIQKPSPVSQPTELVPEEVYSTTPLFGSEAAECVFYGQVTTDYWSYDGKTKKCKCRPCLRQKKA